VVDEGHCTHITTEDHDNSGIHPMIPDLPGSYSRNGRLIHTEHRSRRGLRHARNANLPNLLIRQLRSSVKRSSCLPSLRIPVSYVFGLRSDEKMMGIYAASYIAAVEQLLASGYLPSEPLPQNSMSKLTFPCAAIAVLIGAAHPQPTSRFSDSLKVFRHR